MTLSQDKRGQGLGLCVQFGLAGQVAGKEVLEDAAMRSVGHFWGIIWEDWDGSKGEKEMMNKGGSKRKEKNREGIKPEQGEGNKNKRRCRRTAQSVSYGFFV